MPSDNGIRLDHQIIFTLIEEESRVLDLGCGNGELLHLLAGRKGVKGQGIELDDAAVYECIRKGLSVIQSDIESGLMEYPDASFDYVVLNQSMQEVKKADFLIAEALRVGSRIIIGFPNFAFLKARWMLCCLGRAPVTPSLPYTWYDTPNVRFLSIRDFRSFCEIKNLRILESRYLGENAKVRFWPNLFAQNAIFVLAK